MWLEHKLEHRPDNSGWIKYNLDGTKHTDAKKSTKQQKAVITVDNGPQIEAVTNQVKNSRKPSTFSLVKSRCVVQRSGIRNNSR
jgi:hypothetical protein